MHLTTICCLIQLCPRKADRPKVQYRNAPAKRSAGNWRLRASERTTKLKRMARPSHRFGAFDIWQVGTRRSGTWHFPISADTRHVQSVARFADPASRGVDHLASGAKITSRIVRTSRTTPPTSLTLTSITSLKLLFFDVLKGGDKLLLTAATNCCFIHSPAPPGPAHEPPHD